MGVKIITYAVIKMHAKTFKTENTLAPYVVMYTERHGEQLYTWFAPSVCMYST